MPAEASPTSPSALDGYLRAKPDEPVFVLQGGDELAVRLVKIYIWYRRKRALEIEDERKRNAELVRCTEAEKVLWSMQAYLKGQATEAEEPEDVPDEPEVIALHDYLVKASQRLANAAAEVEDIREELSKREFLKPDGLAEGWLGDLRDKLTDACKALDPRKRLQHG